MPEIKQETVHFIDETLKILCSFEEQIIIPIYSDVVTSGDSVKDCKAKKDRCDLLV